MNSSVLFVHDTSQIYAVTSLYRQFFMFQCYCSIMRTQISATRMERQQSTWLTPRPNPSSQVRWFIGDHYMLITDQ